MGWDEEKTREMLSKDLTVGLHHPTAFQRCCAMCSILLSGFQEVVHSVSEEHQALLVKACSIRVRQLRSDGQLLAYLL
jgi:hypothetical protein